MTTIENPKEHAEYVKRYVISYLSNLDSHLITEGPHEAFNEFLCSYGYHYSAFIMDQIIPYGVFNEDELKILTELEDYIFQILRDHQEIKAWDYLTKEQYLYIKSLSYDYLTLVLDLKKY
jgi:hypothetical protein